MAQCLSPARCGGPVRVVRSALDHGERGCATWPTYANLEHANPRTYLGAGLRGFGVLGGSITAGWLIISSDARRARKDGVSSCRARWCPSIYQNQKCCIYTHTTKLN